MGYSFGVMTCKATINNAHLWGSLSGLILVQQANREEVQTIAVNKNMSHLMTHMAWGFISLQWRSHVSWQQSKQQPLTETIYWIHFYSSRQFNICWPQKINFFFFTFKIINLCPLVTPRVALSQTPPTPFHVTYEMRYDKAQHTLIFIFLPSPYHVPQRLRISNRPLLNVRTSYLSFHPFKRHTITYIYTHKCWLLQL